MKESHVNAIVAIGASAGGLEALEAFLVGVPPASGLSFVVIQHLDPKRKGMLVEFLQRATKMTVVEARERTPVAPDVVYVIPPDKDLSIVRGVLHVLKPASPRGRRTPIDFFFRAVAADQGARSVGVVLSGMGSDGTLGLRAIKGRAGAAFVQSPESAKFDSMPRSAIDAGLADVVAAPGELAARILEHLAIAPEAGVSNRRLPQATQSALEEICAVLQDESGHDFSQYKSSTIYRRIERRIAVHKLRGIAAYAKLLEESAQEKRLLFDELLIGVTSFFRDAEAWEHLRNKALPELLSSRTAGTTLRAWVAGCSTGEEAYSLAIVFKEAVDRLRPPANFSLQIFATDLDKSAIERARAGLFPATISSTVSAERRKRFFVEDPKGFRVRPELREMVIFAPQNLTVDPPFTRLDILTCRNVLIYFRADLQKKLFPLFHYSLTPGGILFLGSAETIAESSNLFRAIDTKSRLYRRLGVTPRPDVEFPTQRRRRREAASPAPSGSPETPETIAGLVDRLLLDRFAPIAVLTNDKGDIAYVSGRTGRFLEPPTGKVNWNIHAMARPEIRRALNGAFQAAARTHRTVTRVASGVEVVVEPLREPKALRSMMLVAFSPVPAGPATRPKTARPGRTPRAAELERELEEARELLRETIEEMQTSEEELKSSNEELQSTNEELQSTNEELMTSKEEMQSLNEELQTLGEEQQAKVDELSRNSDDMRNLLESTDIATLFLDRDLKVRRFTTQVTRIFKLIPGDVDRPITDLASSLVYPDLVKDARGVLQTLVFRETTAKTVDERWYNVRIMPYRTIDDRIDGLVITFVDITAAKKLEEKLRRGERGET